MNTLIPDPEDVGKLFVGGLNSVTTKESLQNYFSQFGEVVDSVVMKNMETGRSRGFGFVSFKDPNCIHKALQVKHHELDGKKIDPKECTPRSMQKTRKQAGKCKVFMGGLPPDITEADIRSGMSRFGKVDQVVIMYDQETKKCRGFGFLSFELEESIDQACAERFVTINGKQIECKKAEPRINPKRAIIPKNQNGFVGQSPYGQISPGQQAWSMPSAQPLYNLQGNSAPGYQSYGNSGMVPFNASSPVPFNTSSPVPFNTSSPGYPGVQPLPYVQQQYPSNFGTPVASYNYSPVSPNTFPQTAFLTISQSCDANDSNNTEHTAENAKTCASNNYPQSPSTYGPSKGTYITGNGTDSTFISQSEILSSCYQRYHPYKA